MGATVPFTVLEEAIFHIERKYTPWNVQVEVETSGDIDTGRLHEAAVEACDNHPLARARRREHSGYDTDFFWEIPESVETVPVGEATVDDQRELDEVRTGLYGERFDLTEDVPFRLMVTREPDGDRLLVCTSHVPCDGIGALRLTRSVCQAYRGETPDSDPVDFETARGALEDVRPSSLMERLEQIGNAAKHLGNTVDGPDRIAKDGTTEDEGCGFVHEGLDGLTEKVVKNRPDGVSVNDVLLANLHTTIDGWNRRHRDPADKISLMMPVNLRPTDWFYGVVGMYALFETVSTKPPDRRDTDSVLQEVARQTTKIKERDTAVSFLESLRLIHPETPVGVRGQMPELLKGLGSRLVDTAVLSNLGVVPEPVPSLTGDGPEAVWFSPPCQTPTTLGLGVVTAGGSINLSFRHAFSVFDRGGARDFADLYVENLTDMVARRDEVS